MRPTRGQAGHLLSLYSALLRMGFTQPTGHPVAGGLLPHHFTLTFPLREGRYVSVALSVGSPLLGVTQHPCPAELGLSSPESGAATRFT